MYRAGQNHIYTVYILQNWQGGHQLYTAFMAGRSPIIHCIFGREVTNYTLHFGREVTNYILHFWQGGHQLYTAFLAGRSPIIHCIFGREVTNYTLHFGREVTNYILHFWQGGHQLYSLSRRIHTVLANPNLSICGRALEMNALASFAI